MSLAYTIELTDAFKNRYNANTSTRRPKVYYEPEEVKVNSKTTTNLAAPTLQAPSIQYIQDPEVHSQYQKQLSAKSAEIDELKDEAKRQTVRYQLLKMTQKEVLEHLEDARTTHIEREIGQLVDRIPQRKLNYKYECEKDRDSLTKCYNNYLNLKNKNDLNGVDVLQCQPHLKKFAQCAQDSRKVFLDSEHIY
ncbi:hypothetical protein AKO1_013147 [Acrasis kona]|uniref:MICOS complex subunit MIC19 n=1 Tax=Acrasis kona TaxID=1008807 RepID=A0AAW2YYB6_9EUKA